RLEDYVPAGGAASTLFGELVRIDLEYRHKRGLPVLVDSYLQPFPELRRDEDLLLEVIAAECRARQDRGEPPAEEAFARRFPNLADRLAARLSALAATSPGTLPDRLPPAEQAPQVPGYQLVSVLGAGGMGVVWRARDRQFRRSLAVKVLAPQHK